MHIKGNYSWLKHLDFMVLDILSLVVAFVLAIGIRFGEFSRLTRPTWKTLLLIACLMDLLVILFTNPFSGIFRRYGSEELLKTAAGRYTPSALPPSEALHFHTGGRFR